MTRLHIFLIAVAACIILLAVKRIMQWLQMRRAWARADARMAEIEAMKARISLPPDWESMSLEERIRLLFSQTDLSQYAQQVLDLRMNSIRVTTLLGNEDEPGLGTSRIGGVPDLPPGIEWPWNNPEDPRTQELRRKSNDELVKYGLAGGDGYAHAPLSFIAQFRMTDVAPYDTDGLLPHSGMLYFFYDAVQQPGGSGPNDPTSYRVICHDGDLSQLRKTPPPNELGERGQFEALGVAFSSEVTLPQWESVYLERMGMSQDEQFAYGDVLDHVCPERQEFGVHRMLGHPNHEQGDVFQQSVTGSEGLRYDDPAVLDKAADYRLLLQVDSVSRGCMAQGMMWGDVGHIYFCIKGSDLEARDFSNVWLVHQCG